MFLSDIKCSKNALNLEAIYTMYTASSLNVKDKGQKMKLFINQSNSIIIKAVSGKHKIGLGTLNQSKT